METNGIKAITLKTPNNFNVGDILPFGDMLVVVIARNEEDFSIVFEGMLRIKKASGAVLQPGQSIWVDIANPQAGVMGIKSIGAAVAQLGIRMVGFSIGPANPEDPDAVVYWDGKITVSLKSGAETGRIKP